MDSPWAPYLTSHHPPATYQHRPPRRQVLRRRQPVPNGGGCARGERSRVAAAQRTAAWQVGKIASVRQVSYGAVGDRSGEAARRSSGTSMTTDKRPWSAPVRVAWIVRPWQTTTHGFLHEWQVTGGCSSTQDVCWTMPSFKRPDRKGWCCPCPSPSCCIKDGTACRSAGGAGTEGERQRTGEEQQQVQAVQVRLQVLTTNVPPPLSWELPVNVQKGMFKYLEQRGITLSATHDYTVTKQAKEYIRWMTKLKDFVRQ